MRISDWSSDVCSSDLSPLGAARTELPLHKYESLRYGVAPERKPDVHKFGGMIPVEVKKAGRLIVALDAGAWIDLVRDGAAQTLITHGHGPACSATRRWSNMPYPRGANSARP